MTAHSAAGTGATSREYDDGERASEACALHCTRSMRRCAAILAVALVAPLAIAGPARAGQSKFRLIGLKPTAGGARAELTFENNWGNAQATEHNREVELFAMNKPTPQQQQGEIADGFMQKHGLSQYSLGVFEMRGTGTLAVPIDYAKLGFKPGEELRIFGYWKESKHCWGEPWTQNWGDRGSGTMPLPAPKASKAKRNGALSAGFARCWIRTLPRAPYRALGARKQVSWRR